MSGTYKYDAFISYRHLPLDKAVAERLQKLLETYSAPRGIKCKNVNKITRIFRDESELPTSGDLEEDILDALRQSRYLIVICSSNLKNSKWCMSEIDYFKKIHGGRTNHILAVLAEGNPAEVFPEQLLSEMRTIIADGQPHEIEVELEPLAANVIAPDIRGSLRRLKTEFLRIAAPLLGCPYDSLYRRHQRRTMRRIIGAAAVFIAVAIIFTASTLYQNMLISQQRDIALENQSIFLSAQSRQLTADRDRMAGALLALEALPRNIDNPEKPLTSEAYGALFQAVNSENPGITTINGCISPNTAILTKDGKYLFAIATRDGGNAVMGRWDTSGNLLQEFKREKMFSTGEIYLSDMSPSEKMVALAVQLDTINFTNAAVQVWDFQTGDEISRMGIGGSLHKLAFVSDSSLLISEYSVSGNTCRASIWDIGASVPRLVFDIDISAYSSLSLNSDKSRAAAASESGDIKIFDTVTGGVLATFPLPDKIALPNESNAKAELETLLIDISFVGGGDYISVSQNGVAALYSVRDGRPISMFDGVSALAVSVKNNVIAVGRQGGAIDCYELNTGSFINKLTHHNSSVVTLKFDSQEKYLTSGSSDGLIRLWNTSDYQAIMYPDSAHSRGAIDFSDDMSVIMVKGKDGRLCLYSNPDNLSGRVIQPNITLAAKPADSVFDRFYTTDGKNFVTYGDDYKVRIYDSGTYELLNTIPCGTASNPAKIARNGKVYAAVNEDGNVDVRSISDGRLICTLNHSSGTIGKTINPLWDAHPTVLGFSDDSRFILTYSEQRFDIFMWNAETGELIPTPTGYKTLSHDNKWLLCDTEQNGNFTLEVYSISQLKTMYSYPCGDSPAYSVFTPDGAMFAMSPGVNGHTVTFFDTASGQPVRHLDIPATRLDSLTFSDDSALAFGGVNSKAFIWNMSNGNLVSTLNPQLNGTVFEPFRVDTLSGLFIKGNKFVLTYSQNGSLLLWDVPKGQLIARLPMGQIYGRYAAPMTTPDGGQLLISSFSGAVRIMDYDIHAIVKQAHGILRGRVLTDTEREAYYCKLAK